MQSKKVEKWSDIKLVVKNMLFLVNAINHPGRWKNALAISNAQVSDTPHSFFVVNKSMVEAFSGFDVICNARLVNASYPAPFKEACMSYPHRDVINTRRFFHIEFEAEVYNPLKIFGSGLSKRTFKVSGIPAFIVQHEIDHAKGINIYEKFKK